MGDHRFHMKISVTGWDCKEYEREMFVNWHPDLPERVLKEFFSMLDESQLNYNCPDLFDVIHGNQ